MTAGKIWRQTGLKHANEVLKFNRTTYKINNGQSVMVPFDNEKNPPVHFFVEEVSRQSEILQLNKLI